jgi:FkbM family methyltransferase
MPPASQLLVNAYKYNFTNNHILECGSYTSGDETAEFRTTNKCYYIEANPEDFDVMCKQPNIQKNNIFNFALSDKIETITFTVTSHPGNSSVCHSKEHIDELIKYHNASFKTITVQAITFNFFIDCIILHPIDILVLDVEGHETHVLEAMKVLPTNKLPKILVIECGYNWSERLTLCKLLGYNLDFYQFNNAYMTHNTANIEKNKDIINHINVLNKEFVFNGTRIYTNDIPLLH